MTISKKLEKAINEQITAEMWSANLYMAMSFFCEKEGFSGFGNWLKKQSNEEISHAYMMADFLIKRGGTAKMGKIDEVPGTWKKPIDMFKNVYDHECKVSEMINKLLDLSIEENDKAAQDFFWQFVREQVEEEATASDIVSKIEKFGDSALFMLDSKLGETVVDGQRWGTLPGSAGQGWPHCLGSAAFLFQDLPFFFGGY